MFAGSGAAAATSHGAAVHSQQEEPSGAAGSVCCFALFIQCLSVLLSLVSVCFECRQRVEARVCLSWHDMVYRLLEFVIWYG
jgi:hypothetical protein